MLDAIAAAVPSWPDGMGDALREGKVALDPERTIDAQTRDDREELPFQPSPPAADYGELAQVERRHYMLVREIAKGGMGRVLEARDLRLGRQVAIKELLPKNRDATRRFEREARITARLQHPGIIHVYEAGVWPGGEPFYAMPKVTGRSLDKVVAERATLADRLGLVTTVMAVADALAYAHSEHVIHRDLKPTNVLVGEFGQTVVIDWGLAKELGAPADARESQAYREREVPEQTVSGSVVGTPAYMPPEQARGDTVDQRADVYAIGALLYKVLCGHAPYVGDTSDAILEQVKTRPPLPIQDREAGAPRELVAIVEKAMAREPRSRYADAGELAADLKRFETGQLVAAHRYTTRQLVWRFVRRHRVAIVIGVIAVATLTIGGALSLRRILDETARAEAGKADALARRYALLEERGRTELLEGRAGPALAYLVNAAHDQGTSHARQFLLAEAIRPFRADQALAAGAGVVRVAVSPDGGVIATAASALRVWHGNDATELSSARYNAVAFDPAGKRIVVGGDDGVVRIWPVAGGAQVELPEHGDAVLDVVFSPDGQRVAAASHDGAARVWDLATGTLIATSQCHSAPVVSVRFSPDSSAIATASEDHTACVWSVDNNKLIALLRGHSGAVRSARWSADGNRVVTASDDGTAFVWDARLAKPVCLPLVHDKAVVVAETDGDIVVTASADRTARVWRLPEATATLQEPQVVARLIGHTDGIVAAALSHDGALVATGGLDRLAKVWDAKTGELLATFEHPEVVSDLAFAGGDRLVTGDRDGRGHVWDIKSGVVASDRHDLRSPIYALAASAGVVAVGTHDAHVTLWPGERVLRGHLGKVLAVGFAAGGTRLVSAGDEAQSIVWDVAAGKERCRITHPDDEPARRALATAGDLVAIASDEIVTVWSTTDCSAKGSLDDKGTVIRAIAAAGDDIAVGAGDGTVVLWNVRTGAKRSLPVMHAAVTALAYSPDGRRLAVACEGEARIINPAVSGERLALDGPFGKVTAIGWLDEARVVTASGDGSAKVWDAAKGKLLGVRGPPGEALTSLAIDGDKLWLGSEEGIASAWEVGVLTSDVDQLDAFLAAKTHWMLGDDDVVRRSEGVNDGHH